MDVLPLVDSRFSFCLAFFDAFFSYLFFSISDSAACLIEMTSSSSESAPEEELQLLGRIMKGRLREC